MLTWAMVALMKLVAELPGGVFLFMFAMAGDVLIVFLVACAMRGWPGSSENASVRVGAAAPYPARSVGLWCPDCDRETPHDVSGAPVAECLDCLEPHEMTAAEIAKANDAVRGAAKPRTVDAVLGKEADHG